MYIGFDQVFGRSPRSRAGEIRRPTSLAFQVFSFPLRFPAGQAIKVFPAFKRRQIHTMVSNDLLQFRADKLLETVINSKINPFKVRFVILSRREGIKSAQVQ
jgi:hypothetical protein